MAKPFKGTINLDIRDSTPAWDAFLPEEAPEGTPHTTPTSTSTSTSSDIWPPPWLATEGRLHARARR
jgi:hypothetical protein